MAKGGDGLNSSSTPSLPIPIDFNRRKQSSFPSCPSTPTTSIYENERMKMIRIYTGLSPPLFKLPKHYYHHRMPLSPPSSIPDHGRLMKNDNEIREEELTLESEEQNEKSTDWPLSSSFFEPLFEFEDKEIEEERRIHDEEQLTIKKEIGTLPRNTRQWLRMRTNQSTLALMEALVMEIRQRDEPKVFALPSPYHRAILHAICRYAGVHSWSKEDEFHGQRLIYAQRLTEQKPSQSICEYLFPSRT